MLKIRFIVVDRTRSHFLKEGEIYYLERLRKYARVEWIEVKPVKIKKGRSTEEILIEEGESIAKRFEPDDCLVTLDRSGRQYDSEELAIWLNDLSTGVRGWICFIIGGPLGLSKKILDQAHKVLSLSKLTLTHEMTRLFIIEQIYRAFTILKGEKYHK